MNLSARFLAVFLSLTLFLLACRHVKLPIFFEDEPPPSFSMTNQFGKQITEKEMKGKVYVLDFFFTECPGVCKEMSTNMKKLQDFSKDMWDVHLLSFSVDPETDSVPRLKKYAQRYGAIEGKWDLLTGDYQTVFDLAQKTFHVSALKDAKADGGIFHDERFILIDKKNRIRGFYHIRDTVQFKKLLQDIMFLRRDEN